MAKAIPLLPMFSVVLSWSLCGARTWIIRVGTSLGKLGSANEGEENEAESPGTPHKCWCPEQGEPGGGCSGGTGKLQGLGLVLSDCRHHYNPENNHECML